MSHFVVVLKIRFAGWPPPMPSAPKLLATFKSLYCQPQKFTWVGIIFDQTVFWLTA